MFTVGKRWRNPLHTRSVRQRQKYIARSAGLEELQSGEILLDDLKLARAGHSPPQSSDPWLGVSRSCVVPAPYRRTKCWFGRHNAEPVERERRVNELLDSVGLMDLAARYPDTLSGGQQQRIARSGHWPPILG